MAEAPAPLYHVVDHGDDSDGDIAAAPAILTDANKLMVKERLRACDPLVLRPEQRDALLETTYTAIARAVAAYADSTRVLPGTVDVAMDEAFIIGLMCTVYKRRTSMSTNDLAGPSAGIQFLLQTARHYTKLFSDPRSNHFGPPAEKEQRQQELHNFISSMWSVARGRQASRDSKCRMGKRAIRSSLEEAHAQLAVLRGPRTEERAAVAQQQQPSQQVSMSQEAFAVLLARVGPQRGARRAVNDARVAVIGELDSEDELLGNIAAIAAAPGAPVADAAPAAAAAVAARGAAAQRRGHVRGRGGRGGGHI